MKAAAMIQQLERDIVATREQCEDLNRTLQVLLATRDFYRSRLTADDAAATDRAQHLRDEMRAVLLDAVGPLHRETILERLIQRGFEVSGKNPVGYIGNLLSRDPRFVLTKGERGCWELKEHQNGAVAEPMIGAVA